MGYSYLVLGTGIGRAIAHCLAGRKDTDLITIGDVNEDKAIKSALGVSKQFPDFSNLEAEYFNAEDPDSLKRMGYFDVIISALPARYSPGLAERTMEQGIHFCDLGGVLSITLAMKGLHERALLKNLSVVPDCGLMPGLGVMIARKLVLESIKASPGSSYRDVVIYVGGLPQKPAPLLYYQKVFSLEGLRHLCYDKAVVLVNGRVKFTHPLSGYEIITAEEVRPFSKEFNGRLEAFITAGASTAPWGFKELGVTSLCEKTVRWPGFVRVVTAVKEENFEEVIGPMINIPVDENHPDLVWMMVTVSYEKHNEGTKTLNSTLFSAYDVKSGLTAMEQTTGFTTALIAQAIARGQAMPGVLTPDEALTGDSLNRVIAETGSYFQVKEGPTP